MRAFVAALCALVLATACYKTRTITRQDWGVVPDSQLIRVRTTGGAEYELRKVAFSNVGLLGVGRQLSPVKATLADSVRIPLDSIDVVRVRQLDKLGTAWLVAASATAAFVVIAQSQGDERAVAQPRPDPVSCPFIYSFDGRDYVFDSETYAGAVSRGLERTDMDNLERIRPVNGTYRLQLRNERDETEYTDQLTLHVADHPAGTRAFPDASGTVHVVGQGIAPASMRSYDGDTLPARAGWELSFPRPASGHVALVVRARNAAAAPIVLRTVLDLLGQDVYAWYGRLRSDPFARTQLSGWMLREGGLQVAVRRDSSWTAVAVLPDVGPALAKTLVVPIDISQSAADSVRVRLESSPRLWLLDGAELADDLGRADLAEITPTVAVDENGHSMVDRLAARDGQYLVALKGSRVSLTYPAPAIPPGAVRSVFARTTGHYYFPTRDEQVSRADVVFRIMSDRGFGQRFLTQALAEAGHP